MVLAGIECSPKIFDFRASGIPVQERVDFFDTLGHGVKSVPFYSHFNAAAYITFLIVVKHG